MCCYGTWIPLITMSRPRRSRPDTGDRNNACATIKSSSLLWDSWDLPPQKKKSKNTNNYVIEKDRTTQPLDYVFRRSSTNNYVFRSVDLLWGQKPVTVPVTGQPAPRPFRLVQVGGLVGQDEGRSRGRAEDPTEVHLRTTRATSTCVVRT